MDSDQHEQRQAAAEAFMASLNQLEQSLQEVKRELSRSKPVGDRPVDRDSAPPNPPKQPDSVLIDVKALEEAVADIEQFMQIEPSQDQSHLGDP